MNENTKIEILKALLKLGLEVTGDGDAAEIIGPVITLIDELIEIKSPVVLAQFQEMVEWMFR